jgi:hypothetical protein
MKLLRLHITLIICALGFGPSLAQDVYLTLAKDSILIGEQVEGEIKVVYRIDQDSSHVAWPEIGETLAEGVDILTRGKIDTIANADDSNPLIFHQIMKVNVSSFDSGFFAIDPLKFVVNGDSIESNAALLSVYYPAIDMQADIKDIKGIKNIEFGFVDWLKANWLWVLIGLMVLIGGIWSVVTLNRKKPQNEKEQETPRVVIPEHIIALKRLKELKEKQLWKEGKVKAYYSELTNIFRHYLERRYNIPALEVTSHEIMIGLKRKAISQDTIEQIGELLVLADLVKFAKEKPLPNDHERAFYAITDFINSSKRESQVD